MLSVEPAPGLELMIGGIGRLHSGDVDRFVGAGRDVALYREMADDGTLFGAGAGLVRSAALARIRCGEERAGRPARLRLAARRGVPSGTGHRTAALPRQGRRSVPGSHAADPGLRQPAIAGCRSRRMSLPLSKRGWPGSTASAGWRRTRCRPTAAISPPSWLSSPAISAGRRTCGRSRELAPADIRAYLARRSRDGYERTSTARAMATIRSFFRFLDRRGLAQVPAVHAVRTPRAPPLAAEAADRAGRAGCRGDRRRPVGRAVDWPAATWRC